MLPLLAAAGLWLGMRQGIQSLDESYTNRQNKSYTDFINNLIAKQTQGSALPGTTPDPNQAFTQGLIGGPQGPVPMPAPQEQGIMSQLPLDPMKFGQGLLADPRTAQMGARMMEGSWDRGGSMQRLQAELDAKERMANMAATGQGKPDITNAGTYIAYDDNGQPIQMAIPGSQMFRDAEQKYAKTESSIANINSALAMFDAANGKGTWGSEKGAGKLMHTNVMRTLADMNESGVLNVGEMSVYADTLADPSSTDFTGTKRKAWESLLKKVEKQRADQIKSVGRWGIGGGRATTPAIPPGLIPGRMPKAGSAP